MLSTASLAALALVLFSPSALAIGRNCGKESHISFKPSPVHFVQSNEDSTTVPTLEPVPANLKIAFLGDQGLGTEAVDVLTMVKDWGADFVVHSGDFDYKNNPSGWFSQLESVLGPNYPYFTSIGNHDTTKWTGSSGYQAGLVTRIQNSRTEGYCEGEVGVNLVCTYKGVVVIYSGVGTRGSDHVKFIDDTFNNPAYKDATWKVCSWHKNQHAYQTGWKTNEVGYEVYDACRRHGAIIATGHEHSFARTHLMSDFSKKSIASTSNTLVIGRGQTFAFVSGLGGVGIRSWALNAQNNKWWAATASSSNGVSDGAMLCTFNVDDIENQARCEFRDRTGKVWDSFTILSRPGLSNGFVQQDDSCTTKFVEVQVKNREDDAVVTLKDNSINCFERSVPLAAGNGTVSLVRFRNVQVDLDREIESAHVQIAGRRDGADGQIPAGILVRGYLIPSNADLGCTSSNDFDLASLSVAATSSAAIWDQDDEDWERDAVWVTPNLKALVSELTQTDAYSQGVARDIVFTFSSSEGAQKPEVKLGHSYESTRCMAPTLAIQMGYPSSC